MTEGYAIVTTKGLALDRARGAPPARHAPAGLAGPAHRAADPPLRTRPTRRAGARRRQEARRDPRRRRLAGARPRLRRRSTTHAPRTGPAAGSATTTCTARSTTTPAWPTPRSTPTRRPPPAPASCARAAAWFADHGIDRIERVMTDNAMAYRRQPRLAGRAGRHRRPGPLHPPPTGHRPTARPNASTAPWLDEWAYVRPFDSSAERAAALPDWLHTYNHHRTHTALGGHPPISRSRQQRCWSYT